MPNLIVPFRTHQEEGYGIIGWKFLRFQQGTAALNELLYQEAPKGESCSFRKLPFAWDFLVDAHSFLISKTQHTQTEGDLVTTAADTKITHCFSHHFGTKGSLVPEVAKEILATTGLKRTTSTGKFVPSCSIFLRERKEHDCSKVALLQQHR